MLYRNNMHRIQLLFNMLARSFAWPHYYISFRTDNILSSPTKPTFMQFLLPRANTFTTTAGSLYAQKRVRARARGAIKMECCI